MNRDCDKKIKVIHESRVQCKKCTKLAHFRVSEILLFPTPKIELTIVCYNCGSADTTEHEVIKNNFGLKIKCMFKSKDDLYRRIYLNNGNMVHFRDINGSLVFTFSEQESFVDTVETLITRALDMITHLTHENVDKDTLDYVGVAQKLEKMKETGEMILEIIDPTGCTRVFPRGVVHIKDISYEEPTDEGNSVIYTKIDK